MHYKRKIYADAVEDQNLLDKTISVLKIATVSEKNSKGKVCKFPNHIEDGYLVETLLIRYS